MFEILIAAFTLQLLALPGEKGQFIVSALATKYNPFSVALGASCAFAIWTVIEIYVGQELKGALPESFIEGAMAILLLLFAVVILYEVQTANSDEKSFEEKDRYKMVSDHIPDRLEGGVMAFLIMLFGEVGDKTQIITIGLAAEYGLSWEIWAGEMLAIIPITLLNALAVSKFVGLYNSEKIKYASVVILVLFSLDIFISQITGTSLLPF